MDRFYTLFFFSDIRKLNMRGFAFLWKYSLHYNELESGSAQDRWIVFMRGSAFQTSAIRSRESHIILREGQTYGKSIVEQKNNDDQILM